MPSERTQSKASAEPVSNSWYANRFCRSRSGNMRLQHRRGPVGLSFEDRQFRYLRVPLNEGGDGSKAPECSSVQMPNLWRYVRIVCVDTEIASFKLHHRMTGEVNFLHSARRNPVQEGMRVKPVVHRVHEHVIDVQQYPTAGFLDQRGQKLPLGYFCAAVA